MKENPDFRVSVNVEEQHPEIGNFTIKVQEREDGWYADLGDGYELYKSKEDELNLRERDIRQLLNKKFNCDYTANPDELNLDR
jgi:hypothetical protein